jgi:hypothetical protein
LADVAACKGIANDGVDRQSCDRRGGQILETKETLRYGSPAILPPVPNFGPQPKPSPAPGYTSQQGTAGAVSSRNNPQFNGEPHDQNGRPCGKSIRLPDYKTALGDVIKKYEVINGCSSPITFKYRFDDATYLSSEIVPAGGRRTVSCIDVKSSRNMGCSGNLSEERFEP